VLTILSPIRNEGKTVEGETDVRVKPFDDLMYFPTTLGMESATDSTRSKLDPQGLCVCSPYSNGVQRSNC